ncbi:MAG: hypothetical protein H0X39_16485 [Actinobacteria bacterium]|nr:hypothetical protein [Actinomycetota bacterium]
MSVQIPSFDELARVSEGDLAEHQVAALTALEAAVIIISRSIVATYPPVHRLPQARESHRRAVSIHLIHGDPDPDDRPF